jgi:hypothetical protein
MQRHAILFLLLAVTGAAWASSAPNPKATSAAVQSGLAESGAVSLKKNDGTAQTATALTVLTPQQITDAIATGIERANERHDASHPLPPPDNSGWWFNLFLVVFTGLLVVAGGGQSFLIFWTLKATQTAARAAQVAAEAATKSADTQVAIELPIFVIEGIQILRENPHHTITFGNHGRTPAIITADCLVLTTTQALDSKCRYPINEVKGVEQDRVVGQGMNYPVCRTSSISEDEWTRILKGETILWAYGYIDYLDFLKREHREGFCIGFEPARIGFDTIYTSSPPSGLRWSRNGPPAYTYNEIRRM